MYGLMANVLFDIITCFVDRANVSCIVQYNVVDFEGKW